jgi:hypothetical protein
VAVIACTTLWCWYLLAAPHFALYTCSHSIQLAAADSASMTANEGVAGSKLQNHFVLNYSGYQYQAYYTVAHQAAHFMVGILAALMAFTDDWRRYLLLSGTLLATLGLLAFTMLQRPCNVDALNVHQVTLLFVALWSCCMAIAIQVGPVSGEGGDDLSLSNKFIYGIGAVVIMLLGGIAALYVRYVYVRIARLEKERSERYGERRMDDQRVFGTQLII